VKERKLYSFQKKHEGEKIVKFLAELLLKHHHSYNAG